MEYRIEVYDTWGWRIASHDSVPIVEAVRTAPDRPDRIRGLLPGGVQDLSPGYRVKAFLEDRLVCEATVEEVSPEWSDARKLILDRYVHFHEAIAFAAEREPREGNRTVERAYTNRDMSAIARSVLNTALGPVHYWVSHGGYPDGAEREYEKFLARKSSENELGVGSIATGQWVGSDRIDATEAYAKDGDTIAGLEVDGEAWPDLRLMLIDCEELSKNSHAVARHPEIADWTSEQYTNSGYHLKADKAKAALQDLIDTKGIDFIELNPHRDGTGAFDDRVDAYGRYLGLVYGGGECFNAAMVEKELADVYLYEDGRYLVPEMELKDFFSYLGEHHDSIEEAVRTFSGYDVHGGALEILTALSYAADGYVWSSDHELGVGFRTVERPDRVVFYDPVSMGVELGSDSGKLVNTVYFEGNPLEGELRKSYFRGESIDEHGVRWRRLPYFALSTEEDADKLVECLLDDVAYPEPSGTVVFFHGNAGFEVGDAIELRGAPLRRIERELAEEWGGRFTGDLVGRVRQVIHRFTGRRVETRVSLTSPLRSVEDPIGFMVRGQPGKSTLYQFRLDAESVGLDLGYHLD